MVEVLLFVIANGLAGYLGWHLGSRHEIARQTRLIEATRLPPPKPKEGLRLKRIRLTR